MKENFGLDLSPFKITMSQVKLMKQKEVKKGRKYTKTLKIKKQDKTDKTMDQSCQTETRQNLGSYKKMYLRPIRYVCGQTLN